MSVEGDSSKIAPAEWRQQIMSRPDWDEALRRWVSEIPDWRWDQVTDTVFAAWRAAGDFDRPGWWDATRDGLTQGGAWDRERHRLSHTLIQEHLFRAVVDDMTYEEMAIAMVAEVHRVLAAQQHLSSSGESE